MIAPAMTVEEWALHTNYIALNKKCDDNIGGEPVDDDGEVGVGYDSFCVARVKEGKRHALAALALHGQPFGFTREDVTLIRQAIPWIHQRWDESVRPEMDALESLANRIEALLPPEEL